VPPVVATGLISAPVPGAWRRLNLISTNGLLTELEDDQLVGRLEELGIPRHHYGLARAVQSWRRAAVPPDVALALWMLRERTKPDGELSRHADTPAESTGGAIRYIQLSLTAGETTATDPLLLRVAQWLLDHQLPDGSIPADLGFGFGEAGATGRVLRLLNRLGEPAFASNIELMRQWLVDIAIQDVTGAAWAYSRVERTPVTGATSHVVLALLEQDPTHPLVAEGIRFLVAAQDSSGGWSEVPGYAPTTHNTFNVVRVIRSARKAGVLDEADTDGILAAATGWLLRHVRRQRTVRVTGDIAFALRLAAELDVLHARVVEKLALRLLQRRRNWLSPRADIYAETEITALALLECSQHLDSAHAPTNAWSWRWGLPTLPPPFLYRTTYLYDLLYSAFRARWWVGTVDRLASKSLVERMLGVLLGTITALGIVDDYVTSVFAALRVDARGVFTVSVILLLLCLWILLKASWTSSTWHALLDSIGPLIVAALLTWIFYAPAPIFPPLIAFIGLRWLVIDVIAFTANNSGLLNRLLFE
jgi:Prenyltransferase and squalene oxidase repeat